MAWGFISDEVSTVSALICSASCGTTERNGRPGYGHQSVGAQQSGVRPGEGCRMWRCGTVSGTNTDVLSPRLGEHMEDTWALLILNKRCPITSKSHSERERHCHGQGLCVVSRCS